MPNGKLAPSVTLNQQLGDTLLEGVVDYDIRYAELNDLDRIARFFLAAAYSSVYPGNHTKNQALVGARTVAAAMHGSKLYLAANDLKGLGLRRKDNETRPIVIAVNEIRVGVKP